jgi:magnesium-transporting ATPase (P-type)
MLFSLAIQDPLGSEVTGAISDSGNSGLELVRNIILLLCIMATGYVGYNVFFGNSKDGIFSFIITIIIAVIVSALTIALTTL